MARSDDTLFRRLTQLFRSGPIVKRKVKAYKDGPHVSTAHDVFKKSMSRTYSTAMSAYGQYDRMARYSDFSEMEYCLAGDTLIATPGGFEKIQDLAAKYPNGETFIVYSYDHNLKQIVPALGKQARQTRVDHAYKVTFDSGLEIIGTGNHRLMLRDGSYRKIEDLKVDDSMMPFYRRDLFAKSKKPSGYQWIYTMSPDGYNGWTTEHKLIAEWAYRKVEKGEVVHHRNFKKEDNRPENLQIMSEEAHRAYHQIVLNGKKWDPETNAEWIEQFKIRHSKFMSAHNPMSRPDVTFGRILEICERDGFNSTVVAQALDTNVNLVKDRLRENGFKDFETFARSYQPGWTNGGWDNRREKNPRFDPTLTFQMICDAYDPSSVKTAKHLAEKLSTTHIKIVKRLKWAGYNSWTDFKESHANHKVVSVEYYGVIPLYDLTVDGYKNFATDSVISHNTPEISSALDVYSEEVTAEDVHGRVLHIYSENRNIQRLLEQLFYDNLNVEFNLTPWVRDLVKFGDVFLFNDVSPQYGVIGVLPIAVNEIEREELFDPDDPAAVRFRWTTQGNQILENWQVTHMRLLGNDAFLPYGASVLEGARRIWRQLIMMEDAMLVYRVVRSPERRVFYIDVGNIAPEEIPNYMEQAKSILRSNQVVDSNSGRVDKRYNPLSVDEDYFLPVRGGESGSRIDTLAGGTNVTAVEDIQYLQSKLFSALKVPKAYLGYDDSLSSKATLSQEDIRFSRTVNRIQRTVVSELNKLAIIHLYANGYDGEDLLDFTLSLSNPSALAQQQKLELYRAKLEIAGSAPEGLVDRRWLRKNIMSMTDEEIDSVERGRMHDKQVDLAVEATEEGTSSAGGGGGGGGGSLFGGGGEAPEPGAAEEELGSETGAGGGPSAGTAGGGDTGGPEGEEGENPEDAGADEEEEPDVEKLFAGHVPDSHDLLTSRDDEDDQPLSIDDDEAPVKAQNQLDRALYNRSRRRHHGPLSTNMPDLGRMVRHERPGDTLSDPGDSYHVLTDPFRESRDDDPFDKLEMQHRNLSSEMRSVLRSLGAKIGRTDVSSLLFESDDVASDVELVEGIDLEDEGDDE